MEEFQPFNALKRHPDLARRVGFVVAEYALLEHMLFETYVMIAKTDPRTSFRDFYTLRQMNLRTKLVLDATADLDANLRLAFQRVLRRFRSAADRRTEIAHCLYMLPDRQPFRMRTINGEPRFEPMNEAIFTRTLSQYRALCIDLRVLLEHVGGGITRRLSTLYELPAPLGRTARFQDPSNPGRSGFPSQAELTASEKRLGLEGRPYPRDVPDYTNNAVPAALGLTLAPLKTSGN